MKVGKLPNMSNKGFLGDFSKPSSLTPAFRLNYGLSFAGRTKNETSRTVDLHPPGVFLSPAKDERVRPPVSSFLRGRKNLFCNNKETKDEAQEFSPSSFMPCTKESFDSTKIERCQSDPHNSFVKATVSKKQEDSIELYFDYKSDSSFLDKSLSCGTLPPSQKEEEDSCYVMQIRKPSLADILLERRLQERKYPRFIKYIPVELPISSEIPKILHNEKDMAEWEEAQKAYEDMKLGYPMATSRSDENVRKPAPIRKKLSKLIHRKLKMVPEPEANDSKFTAKPENFDLYDTPYTRPKETDERFSEKINVDFLNINIETAPKFSAHLYAMMPSEANFPLCHVKTELLASCLQSFLFPYGDVECFWVTNLYSMFQELTGDAKLRPLLRKLVIWKKFEAALVLSADASKLIRHKDTCFLKTITTVLQIPHHKLLVLRKTDEYEL